MQMLGQIDIEALFWLLLALIYGLAQLIGRFVKSDRGDEEPEEASASPARPVRRPAQPTESAPRRSAAEPPAMERNLRDFVDRLREAADASHEGGPPAPPGRADRRAAPAAGTEGRAKRSEAGKASSRERRDAVSAGASRQASAISRIKERMSQSSPGVSDAFKLGIQLTSPSGGRARSRRISSVQSLVNPRTLMVDLGPLNYHPQELRQEHGKVGKSPFQPDLGSVADIRRAFAARIILDPPRALRNEYADPELDLS